MKKIGFQKKWVRFVMCMAAAMAVFAASKTVPTYAGDFSSAVILPANGVWTEKYELADKTTDYYKFSILEAGKVNVKMMSYAPYLTYTLYDSNYDKISEKGLLSGSESETSPSTESIELWLSQGTYYVAVAPWFNKVDEAGGTYKLYASFLSGGITAADNDSYGSPQNMRLNSRVTGVLTNSNREDWYKVTIPSAGKYRYICQRSSNMKCCLYDSNLSEMGAMYYGTGTESQEIGLRPGSYYMQIEGTYGGTYTCQINEAIPAKSDILTDSKSQAQYKVTKAGRTGGTVTYQKSTSVKTSITVPAAVTIDNITYKVTAIASNAFEGNSRLKKVTIGRNVASVGANAFSKCIRLKSVTIPANVKNIGKKAFYKCNNLRTVEIKTTKLTSSKVGANAFKGIYKKATIKVPKRKFSVYKSILKKKGAAGAVYKKLA